MKKHRFVELAAIAAVVLAGCAPARSASSPGGGGPQAPAVKQRLVGSILADPAGMFKQLTNPGGNGNVPGLPEITDMVHGGVAYSDDLDVWQPLLAEAVPSAENGLWKISSDGRMETTWHLKPNLQWHDGAPFSSEDFAFAAKFNNDLEIGVVPPAPLALIEAIETPDARTIVVKWKEPFIEADSMFTPISVLPLPRHILEKPYAEDKANIFSLPYWTTEYVGVGAFKIREWVPGSHMTLIASDHYVLGRPKLDEIEVRFLTDVNIVTANLLSGAVDKHIGRGLGVEQTMQLRDMALNQNVLLGGVLGSVVPLYPQLLNPDPPLLSNVEFRRALMLGIDRQEMTDTINFKLSPVADSYLQPDKSEYSAVKAQIVHYDFDPRRSAQMIEGLGYTRGPDGMYRDSGGAKLHVNVRTTAQRFIHPLAASSVVDYWKRIGIDADFENAPIPLLGDREYRTQFPGFELVVAGTTIRSRDMRQYLGSETPTVANKFAGANRARYSNPQLDTLIQKYVRTIPMGERLATLGDILHLQTDQLTTFGLFYEGSTADLGPKNLKSVTSAKTWNAHLWQLE